MKKFSAAIIIPLMVLFSASQALAGATASDWSRGWDITTLADIKTLSVTITTDGAGGSLAATTIPAGGILGHTLAEVEIVNDSDTASVTITNANSTDVWALAAMAGSNEIQPGFLSWGVNPIKDSAWTIATGAIGVSDEITIILKFKRP